MRACGFQVEPQIEPKYTLLSKYSSPCGPFHPTLLDLFTVYVFFSTEAFLGCSLTCSFYHYLASFPDFSEMLEHLQLQVNWTV